MYIIVWTTNIITHLFKGNIKLKILKTFPVYSKDFTNKDVLCTSCPRSIEFSKNNYQTERITYVLGNHTIYGNNHKQRPCLKQCCLNMWTANIVHCTYNHTLHSNIQNETAIGDCELAKILNNSLTVIFVDIYILFFFLNFCHFLSFSVVFSVRRSLRWL